MVTNTYCPFGNGNFFIERPLTLRERREYYRKELRHYRDPHGMCQRIGYRPWVCATPGCAQHRSCNRCVEIRYGCCSCAQHQTFCPKYGANEYTFRCLRDPECLF